ncbi:MAG: alanine racemase [Candidatus Gracilibacteria bacterium]|nr:alanine racemase [Candidatus Gracilibacteria bacterium]
MKLNKKLIEEFKNSESKLLAVTKYWNLDETNELISQFSEEDAEILVGLGENRVDSLKEKELEREATHFIGNIQTKEIKYILQYCGTIHSLDNIKQIRKIEEICGKQNNWVKVFLQINIDPTKEGGIKIEEIPKFLEELSEVENISLIGFSAIGKGECSEEEKRKEFKLLKQLRSKYLQNGIVSAGTSRDYKIAIEEEIEIIRVGNSLIEE